MSAALKIEPEIKPKSEIKNKFDVNNYIFVSVAKTREEVVNSVAQGEYQKAVQILKKFSEVDFVYPKFKLKIERYINHCIDIILSLEANKKFIDTAKMTVTHSKQQKFNIIFTKNIEDLKIIFNKVEYSYHQLRARDNRTSYYVVRASWLSLVIVSVGAFVVEVFKGLGATVYSLLNSSAESLSQLLANLI